MSVLCSDSSDTNRINKKFVLANSIEDLNQFEYSVREKNRMNYYSGRNITHILNRFKKKFIPVNDGSVDKAKDFKSTLDKKNYVNLRCPLIVFNMLSNYTCVILLRF